MATWISQIPHLSMRSIEATSAKCDAEKCRPLVVRLSAGIIGQGCSPLGD